MTSGTKSEIKIDDNAVQTESFPRTIGGRVYKTPEELAVRVKELKDGAKELASYLKTSKTRVPSPRRILAEKVIEILNANMGAFKDVITKFEAGSKVSSSIKYDVETKTFSYGSSSGGGGGQKRTLTVDGKEYPSAKAAREQLHPETKGDQQNRKSIISYLESKNHKIPDKDKADSE